MSSVLTAARADSTVAYSGTYRVIPFRLMALRPAACWQTRISGTSGQTLTCQRALVKTAQADSAETWSLVTSTMTALGSSNAVLMTESRRSRSVLRSRTPSTLSNWQLPQVRTDTASGLCELTTAIP